MSTQPSQSALLAATGRGHRPVMLEEVIDAMAPRDGAIYVDGTFGAGGYSQALLDSADCQVYGIDRDPRAIAMGRELADHYPNRLHMIEGCFGSMATLLPSGCLGKIDGISLDLGVSSLQIDESDRGFSFQADGPLDMRMEGAKAEHRQNAAELVMTLSEKDLADILFRYGEERQSRQIARAIVRAREEEPIERTGQLATIVRAVITRRQGPARSRDGGRGPDPATRTFQALRIYVNDELGELERGLEAAEQLLAPGGRLVVVSFHSLEDRITKAFLRERSGQQARPSRHQPESLNPCQTLGEGRSAAFTQPFRQAKKPSDSEILSNPRARSARLRVGERTSSKSNG